MATELEITSWRNVLDLLSEIRAKLTQVNAQSKLALASSAGFAAFESTLPALVGFGVSKLGKKGKKQEWRLLIKEKVLSGTDPATFVDKAYLKSTGEKPVKVKRWKTSGHTGIITVMGAPADKVEPWLNRQTAARSFMLNDLIRFSDNLQLELNRVRVPMPKKFKAWLNDLRDTAITVESESDPAQKLINIYRLWELTTFKGELTSDINKIKKFVDARIAEVENAAKKAAPAKVASEKTPAPAPTSTPVSAPSPAPATLSPIVSEPGTMRADSQSIYAAPVSAEVPEAAPAAESKKLPAWVIPAIGITSAIIFGG